MATAGVKNGLLGLQERKSIMIKGKALATVRDQNEGRPALKEINNKMGCLGKGTLHGKAQIIPKKVPQSTIESSEGATVPLEKPLVCNKQPYIKVKITKACQLRDQFNRTVSDKNLATLAKNGKAEALNVTKVMKKSFSAVNVPAKENTKGPSKEKAVPITKNNFVNVAMKENITSIPIRVSVANVPFKENALYTVNIPFKENTLKPPVRPKENPVKHTVSEKSFPPLVKEEQRPQIIAPKAQADDSKTLKVVVHNESKTVCGAFSSNLLEDHIAIDDVDKTDENDPIMLGLYAPDMFSYLREMEKKFPITPNYLSKSKLTAKMRATLLDWLIEVQKDMGTLTETLFLTVAIIDRFLQVKPSTSRSHLQLVGVTAMFIANKYEEIMIPDIRELVYVTDNCCSKEDIISQEMEIVKALDFSFGRPLPIHFLRRYSTAASVKPVEHTMAKYITELCILEYDLCHLPPSLLAAAALYIALWLYSSKSPWTKTLVHYSLYTEKKLMPTVKQLVETVLKVDKSHFQSVRKKYAQPKLLQVSVRPELKNLSQLAKLEQF